MDAEMIYKETDEVKRAFASFTSLKIIDIERLTSGNVNDTYKITAASCDENNSENVTATEVEPQNRHKSEVGAATEGTTKIRHKSEAGAAIEGARKIENKTATEAATEAGNKSDTESKKKTYILQRMNRYAYESPERVMENVSVIGDYLKQNGIAIRIPEYCRNLKGGYLSELSFQKNGDASENKGEADIWRLCDFIDSTTYNKTVDTAIVREAGAAFGRFEASLRNFDPECLNTVIQGFHDTGKRYGRLLAAYADNTDFKATITGIDDINLQSVSHVISGETNIGYIEASAVSAEIKQQVRDLLSYLLSVRSKACTLTDLRNAGKLPLRVTHNDTKINNVLFEKDCRDENPINVNEKISSPRAIAIIDLDTCMPGLVADDFGDGIRYAAGITEEGRITFNFDNFKAFSEGFIPQVASYLTPLEKDTLYLAPFSMAVELAVRYLTDFLEGNRYFHTDYYLQNLDKSRQQAELSRQMLEREKDIRQVIEAQSVTLLSFSPYH